VSVKDRACKPNVDRDISSRQVPGVEDRITSTMQQMLERASHLAKEDNQLLCMAYYLFRCSLPSG
jgi:hypothetical protein